MFISAAFVRSWNLSALTLWSQGGWWEGGMWHRSTARAKFFPFFAFSLPPPASPAACHVASRQTVFILRRFALFDAADKSNSCSPPALSHPPPSPWEPFVPFGAASFSIDFRGFAAKQSRGAKANSTCPSLVCWFFFLLFSGNVAPTTCAPCCSCCCCFSCCLDASLCAAIHRKV